MRKGSSLFHRPGGIMKQTYLLHNADLGLIKIGVTKDLKTRLRSLPKGFTDITPALLHSSIENCFKHFYKAYNVPFKDIQNEVFKLDLEVAIEFLLKAQNEINQEPDHAPRWMKQYADARRAKLKNKNTELWFMKDIRLNEINLDNAA